MFGVAAEVFFRWQVSALLSSFERRFRLAG
jgi:hypothetical protein